MGWMVLGLNPGGGEIFRTCPDRSWGPPSLLYNGYRVFPGGKERPGREADPSSPSSAVGRERVELYLYSPLWAVRPVQSLNACTRVHFTLQNNRLNDNMEIFRFMYLQEKITAKMDTLLETQV